MCRIGLQTAGNGVGLHVVAGITHLKQRLLKHFAATCCQESIQRLPKAPEVIDHWFYQWQQRERRNISTKHCTSPACSGRRVARGTRRNCLPPTRLAGNRGGLESSTRLWAHLVQQGSQGSAGGVDRQPQHRGATDSAGRRGAPPWRWGTPGGMRSRAGARSCSAVDGTGAAVGGGGLGQETHKMNFAFQSACVQYDHDRIAVQIHV